ncbi:MAG: FAD-binding protein [Thaumarchaeota archaeon]|nr:FAD-binding protein [Nitrososphaerota archaeon]
MGMTGNEAADVVIVGFGAAGASAAITAHDSGAGVVILEKMETGGGNSAVSGGGILCPANAKAASAYLKHLGFADGEEEIIQTFVRESTDNRDWVGGLGCETEVHAGAMFGEAPGAWAMTRFRVLGKGTPAENLWKVLSSNVEKRGIKVFFDTKAVELTQESGRVTGVSVERKGERFDVAAKKGVILCCGGFQYDEELKRTFLRTNPLPAAGNVGNSGDGVRMAMKVGASLWHMNSVSAPLGYRLPSFEAGFLSSLVSWPFIEPPPSYGFIYVDRNGKRFINECSVEYHLMWRAFEDLDFRTLSNPRLPAYVIFDEDLRLKGPIARADVGYNRKRYCWSKDNSAEIEKGWIIRGENIEELSRMTHLSLLQLRQTFERYNRFCDEGVDGDFGRIRETLVPIRGSPIYAMEIWPCLLNTQGGPKRNSRAQILDAFGKPIPGLYGSGELGSAWSNFYQGGGNLAECLVFGRIAGRGAAKEGE